jgi:hypothetical protein
MSEREDSQTNFFGSRQAPRPRLRGRTSSPYGALLALLFVAMIVGFIMSPRCGPNHRAIKFGSRVLIAGCEAGH